MLQEDLGNVAVPGPVCGVVEGGSSYDVPTVNRDASGEQEIEEVDIIVSAAVVDARAFDIAHDQQCRVREAHWLRSQREIQLIILESQQL